MRKKQSIVIENLIVEQYAAEGKSLARQEGKVIFIENTIPGDVVHVRLTKNKKDWAEGFPIHFVKHAENKVEAFCQHFGICGGCQWQMLPYQMQLEFKQQQVFDNLSRIGKIKLPAMQNIIGSEQQRRYRNKLEFTFSTKEFTSQKPLRFDETPTVSNGALGFHAKGFFDKIVQIQTCHLMEEPTNELRNSLYDFAKSNQISFYDFKAHKGFLRNLQMRVCTTGEVMVNLVVAEPDEKTLFKTLDFIDKNFPSVSTLLYTVNQKWNDSLFDQNPIIYKGNGFVMEQLEDFKFKIGPKSFFQTNTKQAEKLYQITRSFSNLTGEELLYDLYCGTGSIGIFCSRQAKKIIGIENVASAVEDAKENALLNAVHHAQFFAGDVVDVCKDDFVQQHGKPDVIITDPPRAGMHEKLVHKILEMESPTVVYVSCNPATQARDLALLDAKYNVEQWQPVDMFPHTLHIENVVQLKLR